MDDSQIVLFADFDSGNMARYERVFKSQSLPTTQSSSSITSNQPENKSKLAQNIDNSESNINNTNNNEKPVLQQKFDVEFNVWTKPDCDETPVGPNSNRTWFYFGVKGGYGKFIKFNLMNLNRQGRLFEMGMLPVFRSIPGHEKWARIYSKPTWQNLESNFQMSFIHRLPDKRDSITYFAFCFPHSYEECQKMLETYDKQFEYCKYLKPHNCEDDTIYYHRELICYSLDKKRIDLITISACNELSFKQEPRFDPDFLFPKIESNERCFSFDQKKVFILTSRVHPGETPASFVFNGFLEFILRKDDPRAKILRRQFVFKLIPMLNPDGVSRGHYRTDQLGCNLNRVYLDPDFARHPSIYAVKSLIVFHHVNNRTSKQQDGLNFDKLFKLEHEDKDEEDEVKKEEEINKNHLTSRSFNSLSINQPFQSADSNNEINDHNHYIHRSKSFALPSTNKNPDIIYKSLDINKLSIKDKEIKQQKKLEAENFEIGNENSDEDDNEFISEGLYASISNQPSKSIYSPHLNDPRLISINPLWSGIGFYVDLHGHAAKRGCFIYGNSIDNELYQIENVLFPKLISLNSQHFDFDGCNFSVKNMFMKDKREGLSKEGSGRVAMFKILGIIHSYTLECCYASGRVMNTIPPAINTSWTRGQLTGAISPPLHTDLPPKFLPEHYADVGKAIAIAALDITEMNPHTRIPNSSFGNLEAIRNWIKFYIRSKNGGGLNQTNSSNQGFNSQSSTNNVKKLVQKSSKHPLKSNSNASNNISNNSKNNKFISKSLSQPKAKILPQRHSVAVDIISNEDDIFKRSKRTLTSINFKSSNFSLVEQNQSQLKANILKMKQIELNKSKSSPGLIRKTPSFNRIEDEVKLNETPELISSNELKVKTVHRKLMPITKQNLTNSNSNFQNKTTNYSNPNIVLFNKISNIEKTNTLNLNESQTKLNKSNLVFDSPNQRKRVDLNRQKSANATKEIVNIEPVKNETETDTEFYLNDMNDLKQKNALIFQKIEQLELNNIQSQVDEDNLFINLKSKPNQNNSNGQKKSQSFLFLKDKIKK